MRFITIIMGALLSLSGYAQLKPVLLTQKNTLFLDETIDAMSVKKNIMVIVGQRQLLPLDETLYIVIASYGGEYESGLVLSYVLTKVPNMKVICTYCASMAGAIFELADTERLVIGNSQMLMHEMFVEKVTANMLNQKNFKSTLQQDSDDFNKIFWTKMKITKGEYEKKIVNTEYILIGADIVKAGLADRLIKVECDESLVRLAPNTCKTSN